MVISFPDSINALCGHEPQSLRVFGLLHRWLLFPSVTRLWLVSGVETTPLDNRKKWKE